MLSLRCVNKSLFHFCCSRLQRYRLVSWDPTNTNKLDPLPELRERKRERELQMKHSGNWKTCKIILAETYLWNLFEGWLSQRELLAPLCNGDKRVLRSSELKVENSKTVASLLWSLDQLKYQLFRHQFLYHLNNSNTALFRQRGCSAESQQCAAEYKVCLKSIELSLSYGLLSGRLAKQNHSFNFTFGVYFYLAIALDVSFIDCHIWFP